MPFVLGGVLPDHQHSKSGDGGSVLNPNQVTLGGAGAFLNLANNPLQNVATLSGIVTFSNYFSVQGSSACTFSGPINLQNHQLQNVSSIIRQGLTADPALSAGLEWLRSDLKKLFYSPDGSLKIPILDADAQYASLPSNIGTTSTTPVSTGLGVSKVSRTGNLKIYVAAEIFNNTANDGSILAIFRNTTGIPASGSSTGSDPRIAQTQTFVESIASNPETVAFVVVDSGLTLGTTYYYYLGFWSFTGGTTSLFASGGTTILVQDT